MSKKIIIFGASGKVGEAVYNILSNESNYELIIHSSSIDVFPCKKGEIFYNFDIKNFELVEELVFKIEPDVIINCVAETNVDKCETEKEQAWNLNVKFLEVLTDLSKKIDAHLISFSTDYIFNGDKGPYHEVDIPSPINYYGESKLAGEKVILQNLEKYTIIRTNVVYGISSFRKNDFIKWIILNLSLNKKIEVVDGQYANPTLADDIAAGVLKAIIKKAYGIYNIAGKDWMSRYDIALKVAEIFNYDQKLIKKIKSKDLVQVAKRPERAGLITLKAETDLGVHISSLDSGLQNVKLKLKFDSSFGNYL
jgi:dTDP-4-dehydrorhamnose reductase